MLKGSDFMNENKTNINWEITHYDKTFTNIYFTRNS